MFKIDVYKRQIGNNVLVQLEAKMAAYGNGPWYVDSRDGVISVSYTHLDVYKRQELITSFSQFQRIFGKEIVPDGSVSNIEKALV